MTDIIKPEDIEKQETQSELETANHVVEQAEAKPFWEAADDTTSSSQQLDVPTAERPLVASWADINPQTKHERKWLKPVAVGVVAALAGAGALLLTHKKDSGDSSVATGPVPTSSGPAPSSSETAPSSSEGKSDLIGNIDLAFIAPGEKTIEISRPNGEVISVPIELPTPSQENANDFARVALTEVAAFLTTGDQDTLGNFSNPVDVKFLRNWRNQDIAPLQATEEDGTDIQVVIMDDPNNPAKFSLKKDATTGQEYIGFNSETDGALYLGRYYDPTNHQNEWQSDVARGLIPLATTIDEVRFYFQSSPDGKPTITSLAVHSHPTPKNN